MKTLIYFLLALILFTNFGCNKTGIKGTLVYGPTGTPVEDIEISLIPKDLNTEEKSSYIKKGESDKNGEFKITGLEANYTYILNLKSDKYSFKDPNNPPIVSSLTKDQTWIMNQPVIVKDILPGIGCYVKRDKDKFEEVTMYKALSKYQFSNSFRGLGYEKMSTHSTPTIYFTTEESLKSSNATKVKNGDIIYFNITSSGGLAVQNWFICSLQKMSYHENCKEEVLNFGLSNYYIGGGMYFERFYDGVNRISCLGIERYSISKKSPRTENYYTVNLPKGYYLVSSYDFTDKSNDRSGIFFNYILEVTDDVEENLESD